MAKGIALYAPVVEGLDEIKNTVEVREFEIGDSYQLLRDAVEGYIECVHLSSLGVDMWLNEEGKLIGLEPNALATYLFLREFNTLDVIMGNVIFTGGADEEGETLGLTEEQLQKLLAIAE